MFTSELLKTRIKNITNQSSDRAEGKCVLYVMSRDQRTQDNHALLAAQKHAIAKGLPLAVVFCLYRTSAIRAREQYQFMLDGLIEVEKKLKSKNIPLMMVVGKPADRLAAVFHHTEPEAVYFDFSPMNGPRQLQEKLSVTYHIKMFVVDTHNVVPAWVVSNKREIGSRTLRPKIHRRIAEYLEAPDEAIEHPHDWPGVIAPIAKLDKQIQEVLDSMESNGTQIVFESGESAGLKRLEKFVDTELENYAEDRNDPSNDALSDMSPYLHFGQISSLTVALKMRSIANSVQTDLHIITSGKMPKAEDAKTKKVGSANVLLEEMIVRKELSDNFCYYQKDYNSISSADNWAKETIKQHDADPRDHIYSYEELENARTHDEAWNAAQKQLTQTGKVHGYMRMYWAKKIKEWTNDAETAVRFAIKLNDFYSLDGRDPNGYVGILWSIAGVHDRPWTERPVFGKVRYMNYGGLKRKFNIKAYEQQWTNKKT